MQATHGQYTRVTSQISCASISKAVTKLTFACFHRFFFPFRVDNIDPRKDKVYPQVSPNL